MAFISGLLDSYSSLGPTITAGISLVLIYFWAFFLITWSSLNFSNGVYGAVGTGFCIGIMYMAMLFVCQEHRLRSRKRRAEASSGSSRIGLNNVKQILNSQGAEVGSWVQFAEFEKVNWINNQLREIWPYLNKAASQVIKDGLTPVLESYKVGVITKIKVKYLTLGNIGPEITGTKSYRSGDDELTVEMKINWSQKSDKRMVLEVEVALLPDFLVKITDIKFSGTLKVIFKPLTNALPSFGAVLVAFDEMPTISMDIGIMGGDLTALPGLESMIDNIIKSSLEDMLVWPARMVFPLLPGDFSYLNLKPVGYLEIILIEGKEIPKMDIIGKSDPFVQFYVHQKQGLMRRSSVKSSNHNPIWNEVFFIEVEDLNSQKLTVKLMDDEQFGKSECMGSRTCELKDLVENDIHEIWMDMVEEPEKPEYGKKRGSIHFCLTFRPYATEEDAKNSPAKHQNLEGGSMDYEVFKNEFLTQDETGDDKKDSSSKRSWTSKILRRRGKKHATAANVAEDLGHGKEE